MALYIAGHTFAHLGAKCEKETCKVRLVDIMGTTREDIDKEGIACSGKLNVPEYESIEKLRNAIWGVMEHPRP